MKKILLIILLIVGSFSLSFAQKKPTLLLYSGTTMVKPMREMADLFEKKYNCIIKIIQGSSKDVYKSLSLAKKGDLYLPGSESYRTKNLKDGYLLDAKYIGYNQAAIFVQKGNPKKITNLDSLVDENIATILCSPQSGSIGRMTKKLLIRYKGEEFFEEAYDYAIKIGTDSRSLNKALRNQHIDMTINWRATGFWPENKKFIDIIEINQKYAPKKKLILNLLSFSKHPNIAKKYMNFAVSKEGQAIMRKYGF